MLGDPRGLGFTLPYFCPRIKLEHFGSVLTEKKPGMLSPSHSITRCIDMLKRGDRAAAEALWDSYIHRLVALARARLGGMPRRAADEEDVALSAFDSFCRRAECGPVRESDRSRRPLAAPRPDHRAQGDRPDAPRGAAVARRGPGRRLLRRRGPGRRRRRRSRVRRPSSRRRSSTSSASSCGGWVTTRSGASLWRRWKVTPTSRSRTASAASNRRSSGSCDRSGGSGPRRSET